MVKTSFAHVGLNCKDLAATEKFYVRHFGFLRARVVPLGSDRIVFLKSGDIWLELFSAKGDAPDVENDGPTAPGFRHLAFSVENVESKLKELGDEVKVTLGPLRFDDFIEGWAGAWVKDPDGRIIELSQGYSDEENPPPLEG